MVTIPYHQLQIGQHEACYVFFGNSTSNGLISYLKILLCSIDGMCFYILEWRRKYMWVYWYILFLDADLLPYQIAEWHNAIGRWPKENQGSRGWRYPTNLKKESWRNWLPLNFEISSKCAIHKRLVAFILAKLRKLGSQTGIFADFYRDFKRLVSKLATAPIVLCRYKWHQTSALTFPMVMAFLWFRVSESVEVNLFWFSLFILVYQIVKQCSSYFVLDKATRLLDFIFWILCYTPFSQKQVTLSPIFLSHLAEKSFVTFSW